MTWDPTTDFLRGIAFLSKKKNQLEEFCFVFFLLRNGFKPNEKYRGRCKQPFKPGDAGLKNLGLIHACFNLGRSLKITFFVF